MTNPATPRLQTEDPATRRPELLAPAGDFEAMKAAVANGADAVYFGLSNFNARYRAANFELGDLPGVMEFLHKHNTRGFVTLNTLIFSEELEEVQSFIKACADAGVDAVIVQDLGLTQIIRAIAPGLHVHGSTQMTLTEPRAIAFTKDLGVRRVVLARELSVKEIGLITAKATLPVEVFIHGALCVSYSGQCLTSESLGGRSANRGQCAQACRLPYDLVVDNAIRDMGDQRYLLSPQDLAGHALVKDLIDIGVVSLKIEGRLKAPDYVAASTQTYRAALDAATHGQPYQADGRQELDLQQSFSRGFTPGFLDGVNHQRLVPARFPKSRGVKAGTVTGSSPRGIVIALDDHNLKLAGGSALLKPGDGVVFDLSRPGDNEPGGRIYSVFVHSHRPLPGQQPGRTLVEIDLGRDSAVRPDQLPVGAIVWKTDDPESRIRLEQSFARDMVRRKAPITATLVAKVGQPIALTLEDSHGLITHAATEAPAQEARNQPITPAVAFEQIGRLGDTSFELSTLTLLGDVALPAGTSKAMVPKSVLNDLRRQAAAALELKRQTRHIHPITNPNPLPAMREEVKSTGGLKVNSPLQTGVLPIAPSDLPQLHVMVRNLAQLDAALAFRAQNVPDHLIRPATLYADFEDIRQYKTAVQKAREAGVTLGLATIRIIKPHEEGLLKQIKDCQPDMVLARNLAAISFFKEQSPALPLIADYSLNIANELTAGILRAAGVLRMVPSYDLNFRQLAAMINRTDAGVYETVVHQHMPMFHTEHCVFAATLSKGKDFHDCGRPCEAHKLSLRDRVGQEHPVIPDVGCRNTVYNAQAQSAADYLPRFRALGVRHFRVELLIENAEQTHMVLQRYAELLAGTPGAPLQLKQSLSVLSQLGVTAGTLERE
jgi:U32 family peptidase